MELTLWTYEGPPHVGAMRIATSMEGVHYVLHAPQGDTYADLLFTMIERRDRRPPVTYTTFQARDLGGDTAEMVKTSVRDAYERFKPQVMLVGESCTAELIQDQPGSLAKGMGIPIPIVSLELPAYSKKENWGASETLYHLVRTLLLPVVPAPNTPRPKRDPHIRPKANILGPTALGFRCRDDIREVIKLLGEIGVDVNVVAPMGATPDDLMRIPDADFNICLYPEIALTTCTWLTRSFAQPVVKIVPIGVGATRDFIAEIGRVADIDVSQALARSQSDTLGNWDAARVSSGAEANASRLPWYSRSVDSTYLTGKRVFIFGDATHALAAARIATEELGFTLVGIGTYSREFAREVREVAKKHGLEAVISDDYLAVEAKVAEAAPELVLGTQMERHIAKRLGIPCAVISAPIHVQDVPARYSPQMGWEGANVIFDSWVHPLMMGLEEHLIGMFREDFEFAEGHMSHLHTAPSQENRRETLTTESVGEAIAIASTGGSNQAVLTPVEVTQELQGITWSADGEAELKKIPFFVRGKIKRNTEKFASDRGLTSITVETLYDAKAAIGK
ncbi:MULTISPECIES: ferredoxin:protochlorophyllide reductase (ATP-dependent) subunit B [Pseudanabaena]|jgi:light-independent protochlorophyllide reductase subunit B|uniref:ferredoxin:protochlorophyllide reductase (ATP-dependent) subunit B n=1 Tax=Pseudanabaena TaxID=1152 RepID=UPI0024789B82|nr:MULTISPECIES: ferredoxin:protochlorophyllide reductase (ATP-dependent) subunit B [Pseudanabaena]MEA5488906.1 ferredoxin:protochlorophyllide reductase (ATP-dependent) subunit B [Pseudanabaena sp. CCNP1317]WGS72393.1 ferredoxin:protochlorophyllide reductase (ATP-dependent) subunit B [Pseudanabaena galeata CCNP1313]